MPLQRESDMAALCLLCCWGSNMARTRQAHHLWIWEHPLRQDLCRHLSPSCFRDSTLPGVSCHVDLTHACSFLWGMYARLKGDPLDTTAAHLPILCCMLRGRLQRSTTFWPFGQTKHPMLIHTFFLTWLRGLLVLCGAVRELDHSQF